MESIRLFPRLLTALILVAALLLAYWGAQPPRALPENAPAEAFSGMRAMAHSHKLFTEPHPAGSAALGKVQSYLVDRLKEYGLEVEVDPVHVNNGDHIGVVENVMARIPGTGGQDTFGLTTHYDSVAYGPGAADDGSGVVVMLETARVLKQGPQAKNDIVFVFTGDEEHGMGGARRSLKHPWLQHLNVMLAFEARGNHGPAFLFETSPGNFPLMKELAACPGQPAQSTSLMWEVHHRTPNGTDFGSMKEEGVLGYNVAFVGGLGYYHTANDNPDMLSPDSIQHQGAYAVALARHYGNRSGRMEKGEDAVFFNTIGSHLVVYPKSWSLPIAVAAGLLVLASLVHAWRKKAIFIGGTLLGLFLLLVTFALTGAVTYPLLQMTYKLFYVYLTYNGVWYFWAFFAVAFAFVFALYGAVTGRIAANSLMAAGFLFWLVVLAGLQRMLPAGSYAAAWPLVFGAIALAGGVFLQTRVKAPGTALVLQTLLATPVLLVLVPGVQALFYMGPGFTIIPCVLICVAAVPFFAPAFAALAGRRGPRVAVVLSGLAVLFMAIGWATNGYSADKPKMSSLSYGLNLDTQQAIWMSSDDAPDAYTAQFFQGGYARKSVQEVLPDRSDVCLVASAPVAKIQGPRVDLVNDVTDNGRRTVTLHYISQDKAEESCLQLVSPQHVYAAQAEGFGELRGGGEHWRLGIPVMPRSGELVLTLTVDAGQSLRIRVQENAHRLLDVIPPGASPRPASYIPKPNTIDWWESKIRGAGSISSHHTFVDKEFAL